MNNNVFVLILLVMVSCGAKEEQKSEISQEPISEVNLNGEELIKKRCLICHGAGESHDDLLAPPMRGVKNNYLNTYATKEAFVEAIVKWNANPDSTTAIMTGAVKRFKVMPTLQYPENEVKAIAEYIYDNEQPKPIWMIGKGDKHGKMLH